MAVATAKSTTSSLSLISTLRNPHFRYPHRTQFISLSTFTVKTPNPLTITFSRFSPLNSLADDNNGATENGVAAVTSPKNLKSRLQNGCDFVVVDMEHGHGGISDALPCLQAIAAAGTAAIIRVPETCPTWAKKPSIWVLKESCSP